MKTEIFFSIKNGSLFFTRDGTNEIKITSPSFFLKSELNVAPSSLSQTFFSSLSSIEKNQAKENLTNQDNLLPLIFCISLYSSTVYISENTYNEEYLFELRTLLKQLDAKNIFVCIKLQNNSFDNEDDELSCYYHIARRIKDCSHFVGFVLKKENAKKCIDVLFPKHKHYVYFMEETVPHDLTEKAVQIL